MQLHPRPIRIMHWINAITMIIMIGSGWKIYNDEVIFGWLHFPESLTIGKWAQHLRDVQRTVDEGNFHHVGSISTPYSRSE